MNPSRVLTELVNAVLAWEEADARRSKVLDSKSAKKSEVDAANAKLVTSIRQLRLAAKSLRVLIKSSPKKKTKINWFKIIDTVAGLSGALKTAKDQVSVPHGIDPSRVIDMPSE